MSKTKYETLTCHQCGQKSDFILWESLNADLDPQAQAQLLDGTLFQFVCPHCGYEGHVNYSLLYHDMTHRVMVYYVLSEEAIAGTQAMFADVENTAGFKLPDYQKRIVISQNALREKALIFANGLDDRIIEIIKLLYLANAATQFPDKTFASILFRITEDGKYTLEFDLPDDEPLWAEIPTQMYENVQNDFAATLAELGDSDTIVDLDWAKNLLQI